MRSWARESKCRAGAKPSTQWQVQTAWRCGRASLPLQSTTPPQRAHRTNLQCRVSRARQEVRRSEGTPRRTPRECSRERCKRKQICQQGTGPHQPSVPGTLSMDRLSRARHSGHQTLQSAATARWPAVARPCGCTTNHKPAAPRRPSPQLARLPVCQSTCLRRLPYRCAYKDTTQERGVVRMVRGEGTCARVSSRSLTQLRVATTPDCPERKQATERGPFGSSWACRPRGSAQYLASAQAVQYTPRSLQVCERPCQP